MGPACNYILKNFKNGERNTNSKYWSINPTTLCRWFHQRSFDLASHHLLGLWTVNVRTKVFKSHPKVLDVFRCPPQPPAQLKTNTTAVISKARETVWQNAAGLQTGSSEERLWELCPLWFRFYLAKIDVHDEKKMQVSASDAWKLQPSHLSHRKTIINIFKCSADFFYLGGWESFSALKTEAIFSDCLTVVSF